MSQNTIGQGHTEAHQKVTAKWLFQLNSTGGYFDLGNCLSFKQNPDRAFKTRMAAAYGFRAVTDEQVDTVHNKFEGEFDEFTEMNTRLLELSGAAVVTTQSAVTAPSGTATITGVELGKSYFIGKVALDTLVVKVSTVTMVLGSDYTVDLDAGILTVLPSPATILAGDNLALTFGCAARSFTTYTGNENPLFKGSMKIVTVNQFSKEPLETITFACTLTATAFPDQSGDFGKFTLRATAIGAVSRTRRASTSAT